ncbi:class I SAM-dependent methyltransferase [Flavobacterium sp. 3HN19-14]|uniref:class I SAM-dependent methyltransferase n=1 Tax=Flavobacterium sp. 3HN19-14 TaxID=3448133 RepID=UPI003EE0C3E2
MNYEDKASDYFSNVRHDLLNMLDKGHKGLRVLEVGAAYGATLNHLKQTGVAQEAVGIDIFEDEKNSSNYKKIDRFIFGNIEQLDFPEYENYFDLIMFPDVLEHMWEPEKVIRKVAKYLKEDGEIIVSMPNIRHYSAFVKIFMKGNFKYEESGLFDYTHVRFYCRGDIRKLLETSGLTILQQESSIRNYNGRSTAKIINRLTFRLFEEFFSYQYFFKARKANLR